MNVRSDRENNVRNLTLLETSIAGFEMEKWDHEPNECMPLEAGKGKEMDPLIHPRISAREHSHIDTLETFVIFLTYIMIR